jgi:hypothetical protein
MKFKAEFHFLVFPFTETRKHEKHIIFIDVVPDWLYRM